MIDISTDFGLHLFNALVIVTLLLIIRISITNSHWQNRENPTDDHDTRHWDHALLLTGLDLYALGRDGFTTHQVVGKVIRNSSLFNS